MPNPKGSLLQQHFKERIVRTDAVELIHMTCEGCGFIAVGRKERIQAVETQHRLRCREVIMPPKPKKPKTH